MSDLYIPKGAMTLAESEREVQIRLGLQGEPGSGKTFNILTFPNCVVLNFDRGLIAHQGRTDVLEIPFWNGAFVDSIVKRSGTLCPPNRMDALRVWLESEGMKLTKEQTLIVDSNRQVQNAYHTQYAINGPPITQSGKNNKFHEWTEKIKYFAELGNIFKSLKCNVGYLCHEVEDVNSEGEPNGTVKPMLSGESGRAIASDFTDWYRCVTVQKPLNANDKQIMIEKRGITKQECEDWCNSTPPVCQTIYLWQTTSDQFCKCKTSLVGAPKFVIANYSTFNKYKRKT